MSGLGTNKKYETLLYVQRQIPTVSTEVKRVVEHVIKISILKN